LANGRDSLVEQNRSETNENHNTGPFNAHFRDPSAGVV